MEEVGRRSEALNVTSSWPAKTQGAKVSHTLHAQPIIFFQNNVLPACERQIWPSLHPHNCPSLRRMQMLMIYLPRDYGDCGSYAHDAYRENDSSLLLSGKTEVDWTFEQISWPCETPTAAKGQGENGKQKLMFLSS